MKRKRGSMQQWQWTSICSLWNLQNVTRIFNKNRYLHNVYAHCTIKQATKWSFIQNTCKNNGKYIINISKPHEMLYYLKWIIRFNGDMHSSVILHNKWQVGRIKTSDVHESVCISKWLNKTQQLSLLEAHLSCLIVSAWLFSLKCN